MIYQQTLDYLMGMLPMYQRTGKVAYKKDLTNTLELCKHLGNPQSRLRSVHIAGTNGKGSVSHLLTAALTKAGYRTGLYTSPHIFDFRERIRINGKLISRESVVDFVREKRSVIEKIQPSFFELTVAMAFDQFARERVDIAIIETGLGGRLDSTNVINPLVSVITNVSPDHQNMLGNTCKEIAREKGGIIKPKTPVIIGKKDKQTSPVFREISAKKQAPLFFAEDEYQYRLTSTGTSGISFDVLKKGITSFPSLQLDLPGLYQAENTITTLQVLDLLENMHIDVPEHALREGLVATKKITGLRGRWEVSENRPPVIYDIAHNEVALRGQHIQLRQHSYDNLHIIFGMVRDKNLAHLLNQLPRKAHYYFCCPAVPRGLPAKNLHKEGKNQNLSGDAFSNVRDALFSAWNTADKNDLLLVTGSTFVVAEALKAAEENNLDPALSGSSILPG